VKQAGIALAFTLVDGFVFSGGSGGKSKITAASRAHETTHATIQQQPQTTKTTTSTSCTLHTSTMSAPASGNIKADGSITAAGRGAVCIPTADKNAQFRKLKNLSAVSFLLDRDFQNIKNISCIQPT
jgi:hypothetical protein